MGKAIYCDQCETILRVNDRGNDPLGERAAWLTVGIGGESFEFCTISCVVEFLGRPEVSAGAADYFERIAEIARIVREDNE